MFSFKCHLTRRLIYLNEKFLHATPIRTYSDFNKNKKSKPEPETTTISTPATKKKSQLKSFSFIEVKPDSFQPVIDKPRNTFRNSIEQTPEQNIQHQINNLIKQQESIANKLAKLIDKMEPSKTAEKLLEPAFEVKKKKQSLNEILELNKKESTPKVIEKNTEQKKNSLENHDKPQIELTNNETILNIEEIMQRKPLEKHDHLNSELLKSVKNEEHEKYTFYSYLKPF